MNQATQNEWIQNTPAKSIKIYKTCNWKKWKKHTMAMTYYKQMHDLSTGLLLEWGNWLTFSMGSERHPTQTRPNQRGNSREFSGGKTGHHPTWNGLRRISKGRLPQWKKLWDAPINPGFRPCHAIHSDGENVKHSGAWRMVRHRVITRWIPVYWAQNLLANRFLTSWKSHMFGWTAWQQ